jgi:hypothetical protein
MYSFFLIHNKKKRKKNMGFHAKMRLPKKKRAEKNDVVVLQLIVT